MFLRQVNPADNQQVFDFVVEKLRKQNCKSMKKGMFDINGRCLYRGPNRRKCAAGYLIPDKEYNESWEDSGVLYCEPTDTYGNNITKYFQSKGFDVKLVHDLQKVHDNIAVQEWESGFAKVAARFGLKFTPAT